MTMVRCYLYTQDLMAEIRISSALEAGGIVTVVVTADWSTVIEGATDAADGRRSRVVAIVDLTADGARLAVETASDAHVPVIAFGPHVAADTLEGARLAGATEVYPRGRFLRETLTLVESALEA